MMEENERQGQATGEEQQKDELSPDEKLKGPQPTGSLIPGAENPESEEIKNEVNPNTE